MDSIRRLISSAKKSIVGLTLLLLVSACGAATESSTTTGQAAAFDDAIALADGVVTESEYERATLVITTCLEQAGFPVTGPSWDARHRYYSYYYAAPDGVDVGAATTCEDGVGARVRERWHQIKSEEIANDETVWIEFAACLTEFSGREITYGGRSEQEALTDIWYALGPPWVECPHPKTVEVG